MLENAAMMQKHDVVGQPPRLTDVVRHEDHFDSAALSVESERLLRAARVARARLGTV